MKTTASLTKWTRRDAKVGAKFVVTLGYGPQVAFEAKIVKRDKSAIIYETTWVRPNSPPSEYLGRMDRVPLADVSDLISRGLMRFQDFDKKSGLLLNRAMTPDEVTAAKKEAEDWKRFTESETYQSM